MSVITRKDIPNGYMNYTINPTENQILCSRPWAWYLYCLFFVLCSRKLYSIFKCDTGACVHEAAYNRDGHSKREPHSKRKLKGDLSVTLENHEWELRGENFEKANYKISNKRTTNKCLPQGTKRRSNGGKNFFLFWETKKTCRRNEWN